MKKGRGWGEGGQAGDGEGGHRAPEIHMEWLFWPSREINSNPWSPGKGGEGCFPALTLLSKEAGSNPKVSQQLWPRAQQQPRGASSGRGGSQFPSPWKWGTPGERKYKQTRGEAPAAPSPSRLSLSQTAQAASAARQRGQKSSRSSSPWCLDSKEAASR